MAEHAHQHTSAPYAHAENILSEREFYGSMPINHSASIYSYYHLYCKWFIIIMGIRANTIQCSYTHYIVIAPHVSLKCMPCVLLPLLSFHFPLCWYGDMSSIVCVFFCRCHHRRHRHSATLMCLCTFFIVTTDILIWYLNSIFSSKVIFHILMRASDT